MAAAMILVTCGTPNLNAQQQQSPQPQQRGGGISPDQPGADDEESQCQTAMAENAANTRRIADAEAAFKAVRSNNLSVLCPKGRTWLDYVENRLSTLNMVKLHCGRTAKATPEAMKAVQAAIDDAKDGLAQARSWYGERCR